MKGFVFKLKHIHFLCIKSDKAFQGVTFKFCLFFWIKLSKIKK